MAIKPNLKNLKYSNNNNISKTTMTFRKICYLKDQLNKLPTHLKLIKFQNIPKKIKGKDSQNEFLKYPL